MADRLTGSETPPAVAEEEEAIVGLDPSDERVHVRVDVELSVELDFDTFGDVLDCQILNISQGGVFIRTKTPRPEGTTVHLTLRVGDKVLRLDGVVVRSVATMDASGPSGMGVLFTEVSLGQKMLLEALVSAFGYRKTRANRKRAEAGKDR